MTRATKRRPRAARATPSQLERAAAVRSHPIKGDRMLVGGIPWTVLGRTGDLPGAPVVVVITCGRSRTRKTLSVSQWRRIAAIAVVVVDEVRVAPPPRPVEPEDPEQVELFDEEEA